MDKNKDLNSYLYDLSKLLTTEEQKKAYIELQGKITDERIFREHVFFCNVLNIGCQGYGKAEDLCKEAGIFDNEAGELIRSYLEEVCTVYVDKKAIVDYENLDVYGILLDEVANYGKAKLVELNPELEKIMDRIEQDIYFNDICSFVEVTGIKELDDEELDLLKAKVNSDIEDEDIDDRKYKYYLKNILKENIDG